jgi:hypothetical protein
MAFYVELDHLLEQLKLATFSAELSKSEAISVMENLLSWLNKPENNTDDNCQHIDHFVAVEIIAEKGFQNLPEDIKGILFDMGATLHYAHASPEIAENFESMPDQLLDRVRRFE